MEVKLVRLRIAALEWTEWDDLAEWVLLEWRVWWLGMEYDGLGRS